MNFRTVHDMAIDIYNGLEQIPCEVDLIVGIPRSGMLAASLVALYLNLPLTDFNTFLHGEVFDAGNTKKSDKWITKTFEARKILIVEDSVYSGQSLKETRRRLPEEYVGKTVFFAVYVLNDTKDYVDLYCNICEAPRMFEWNIFHHQHIDKVCFDMDGVLCRDPTEAENDDGDLYLNFISNVEPIIIPTFTIGCIVTSRLEKYRKQTEKWLTKNGIQYNELIMMQYQTKEERINAGRHGFFKGNVYKKKKDKILFIESNPSQAEEIAMISGKGVFCTGNHMYYGESSITKARHGIYKKIGTILPKWVKRKVKGI